jgi:hypothetical protein
MLATLLQDNLDTLFCSTDCEWYCKFCEKQWNHICSYEHRRLAACHAGLVGQKMTLLKFAYGQQYVSNIANIHEKLLMYFFPVTDRMWATLKIFAEGSPSLITSFLLTNRE